VTVDADGAVPVGVLARDLARRNGLAENTPLFRGGRPLAPRTPLGDAGLHDGTAVGLGVPTQDDHVPYGAVELRIVGGEDAGVVIVLPPGEYEMGSDPRCRVVLPASVPSRAALLTVTERGAVRIRPYTSLRLADRELGASNETTPWAEGEQLATGRSLLEIATTMRSRRELVSRDDDGALRFNRPPRLVPARPALRFRLPQPPGQPPRQTVPLVAVLLVPVVGAIIMVLITGNWRLIFLGLLSPVAALFLRNSGRKRQLAEHAEKVKEYTERTERLDQDIAEALLTEQRFLRLAHPDPATLLSAALGPTGRLWERRFRDPDFLELRVGTGSIRSSVQVEDPTQDEHRRTENRLVTAVPAAVPLREVGVVGVPDAQLARLMVAEAALLHSPEDLSIVVLTGLRDGSGERLWGWTRWLPHLQGRGTRFTTSTGTSAETIAARVAELSAELATRSSLRSGAERGGAVGLPDILLVLDGARALRALPGVVALLREGPAVGIHVLCLDEDERLLPEECRAVVTVDRAGLRLQVEGRPDAVALDPDRPLPNWYETVARGIAALRPVGAAEESTIPKSVRLLDVLGLEPPTADAVAARWIITPRSTRANLGIGVDGEFGIDLVQDGPHALVAGTTGAGKSELLQTLVASFAVANRPDEMTFVLVDYKGGSAFAECAELPHTVGLVTDLDTHLVERALVSLGAELRRRERVLAEAGAKDIVDYLDKRGRAPRLGPLPRLMLVVDEFASMIRELPDFVSGLVNIAQRGRSLGIHLVLATQRPSGSVTPDIRANTNLRIALRTTDGNESRDIIDAPDAGDLSPATPGRAFARLSASALLPFQAGRIGGRRPSSSAGPADALPPVRLEELTWTELSEPVRVTRAGSAGQAVEAVTDLAVLARAVAEAAATSGIARQPSPWLPPLPDTVTLESLTQPDRPASDVPMAPVAWGLIDLPEEQARRALVVDLDATGHLHIAGAARSGRSQALRTLCAALADAHSVADLHLYGIDCGNGALLALGELPHCGAVVDHRSPERLGRLLDRLTAMVGQRQEQLGQHGVADLSELRGVMPPDQRPPHVVVVLDRLEVFDRDYAYHDNGSFLDKFQALLRDGGSVGVHLVLTGDRVLGSSRYAGTTEDKLVMRLNDDSDYQMLGLRTRDVPEALPSGRALRPRDVTEVQIAVLDTGDAEPDLAGAAQARALASRGQRLAEREAHVAAERRPFQLLALPSRIGYAEAAAAASARSGPLWALAGVGGDALAPLGPDLAETPTFMVAGPPRSGRSTALLTIAVSLLERGTGVLVLAPRRSPLRELAGRPGVAGVLTDADVSIADFRDLLGKVIEPTGAVIVDDAELVLQTDVATDLALLARGAAGDGWALVTGGNAEALANAIGGWAAQARRNRVGLLINPQSMTDGEAIGAKLRRGLVGGPPHPGRAYLQLGDGVLRAIQIPHTTLE
jgi:S-DNA-T family DNA segregation ATPase FtsK/SpoIIIE